MLPGMLRGTSATGGDFTAHPGYTRLGWKQLCTAGVTFGVVVSARPRCRRTPPDEGSRPG
ncbi:hypothetical protein FRAHR75_40157 [Frankia sp. Hr75.2]|nr:hypothetical protein FRAHR75_40157 [Frankia sp. Hr75.2]